ncbi:MAG TPA: hypothetical protein VGT79_02740 [Xanthomonadaceae bacterium]|nr:hypothetical protein [Xanthomonadaceae bacterium]
MNEPIKQGDLCEVIDGALGAASPNIGLRVVVIQRDGEHSKFGPMWLCEGDAELAQPGTRDVPLGRAHYAQAWLKKVPKAPLPAKVQQMETTK